MSVTSQVSLPTDGETQYQPLGGDGFTSPHSVFRGKTELVGDGSGGDAWIRLRFDPRYVQLVQRLEIQLGASAADAVVDFQIRMNSVFRLGVRFTCPYLPVGTLGGDNRSTWSPTPLFVSAGPSDGSSVDYPLIQFTTSNVLNVEYALSYVIYNFDKQSIHRIPIEMMSSVLVRSESIT